MFVLFRPCLMEAMNLSLRAREAQSTESEALKTYSSFCIISVYSRCRFNNTLTECHFVALFLVFIYLFLYLEFGLS